jgi:hypothetical protein
MWTAHVVELIGAKERSDSMGRLIDADALIEAIKKSTCQWEYLWKRVVCDVIQNQPTAYDVEAKVAELEKHRHIDRSCGDVEFSVYLDEAIEIVRGKE